MNNKKKSFLIFEPNIKHWLYVYPLVYHFLDRGWEVTVCGPPTLEGSVWERIKDNPNIEKYQFVYSKFNNLWKLLKKPREAYSVTTAMFQSKMKQFILRTFIRDLLIQLIFYKFFFTIPTYSFVMFEVHKVSTLFTLPQNPRSSNFILKKIEKKLIKMLFKRTDVVNLLSSTLKETAISRGFSTKPILICPSSIYKSQYKKQGIDKGFFSIVITGRIDNRFRDYSWLIHVPENIRQRLEIALVGKANTDEGRKVLNSLKDLGFRFPDDLRGDYVNSDRFNELCSESDIMIAPVLLNKYGKNTMTGSIPDAVQYGKPLLIPEGIRISEKFRGNILFYKNNRDLANTIIQLLENNQSLLDLKRKAHENSLNFTSEKLDYLDRVTEMTGKLKSFRASVSKSKSANII